MLDGEFHLPNCLFSNMEQGFLQLTALSPCFLWNQQSLGGIGDLEVKAGVGDLLERGVLGGRRGKKQFQPVETHLISWREGSPRKKRSDSGRACHAFRAKA